MICPINCKKNFGVENIWDKGKDGKQLPIPIGVDHAIDAFRYHEMETLGLKKNYGQYDVR